MFGRPLRAARITKPRKRPGGGIGAIARNASALLSAAVKNARALSTSIGAYVEGVAEAPGNTWIPLVLSTGLSTDTGKDMPPGGSKHLRWDYHAVSQTVYVCGGDWSSPFYTSGGGDYNTVMFKYTGNGVWARDYPHYLGTPLYDSNIGPAGDFQPPPHCEASFSWAGGDKFLVQDYRTDWNAEGPFPSWWTTGVSRPTIGFATMTAANMAMEYDRLTRKWSKRADIPFIGQAAGAEMAAYAPTRNEWLRIYGGELISATNATTGARNNFSITFPDHPPDGRSDTNKVVYRLVIVGNKCFVYNPSVWPYPPYPTTWPVYIFWFPLSALDNVGVRIPMYWLASLWETQVFPSTVVASEQDMVYVASENALLLWGTPALSNAANGAFNYLPNPRASPESYFVDIDTGAKRAGPPMPRGRNGMPYRPSNTIYFPPTDEIIAHGCVAFGDPYLNASSEGNQYNVEESRQYTIYKRTTNVPTWARLTSEGGSLSLFQWYEIPNSNLLTLGGNSAKVDAWNGFAFRKRGSYLYSAATGGHTDYGGNEVDVLCLNTDTPRWFRMKNQSSVVPSMFSGYTAAYYTDGSPAARHTYHSTHYIENLNRIMLLGRGSTWPTNTAGPESDGYNLDTNTWDPAGTWPSMGDYPNDKLQAQHPYTDDVYIVQHGGTAGLSKFSAAGVLTFIANNQLGSIATGACVIDPVRNRMVALNNGFGCQTINLSTSIVTDITPLMNGPGWAFLNIGLAYQNVHGLAYDEVNDVFLAKPYSWYSGSTNVTQVHPVQTIKNAVIRINPLTWYCDLLPVTGTVRALPGDSNYSDTPDGGDTGGPIYTRFRYVPEMKGLVYYPIAATTQPTNSSVYFMRTS